MDTKEYDLICSLGANCSAAAQLKLRNMRFLSFPFDWTYFTSEKAIYKLADGFENNFSKFLNKENLRKLEGEEYNNSHKSMLQFQDTYSEFFFVNHFHMTNNDNKEIEKGISKFRKRCRRLEYFLSHSNNILLILSTNYNFNLESIQYLLNKLKDLYPDKKFDIIYQSFNSNENAIIELPNLKIYKYMRNENLYDFSRSNIEWQFLDNIKLSRQFFKNYYTTKGFKSVIQVAPPRSQSRLLINLLPYLNTMFYLKLYIFGLRLHIVIGTNRYE